MRIPKEFFIKGKLWRVEYKWNLHDDGVAVDGLCRFSDRTILIRRELLKEEKPCIFMHEFIRAVLFELHLSTNDGWVNPLIEEVMCDGIAEVLLENFKLRHKKSPA